MLSLYDSKVESWRPRPYGLAKPKTSATGPYRKSVLSPAATYRTLSRVSYIAYYARYKDCIIKTPKFKKV